MSYKIKSEDFQVGSVLEFRNVTDEVQVVDFDNANDLFITGYKTSSPNITLRSNYYLKVMCSSVESTGSRWEILLNNKSGSDVSVKDTRDVDHPPSYYYDSEEYSGKQVVWEFKLNSTLNIENTGSNNSDRYCAVNTIAPWGDNTGSLPSQVVYLNNGDIYSRVGIKSTDTSINDTWSEWSQVSGKIRTFSGTHATNLALDSNFSESGTGNQTSGTPVSFERDTTNLNIYKKDGRVYIEGIMVITVNGSGEFQSSNGITLFKMADGWKPRYTSTTQGDFSGNYNGFGSGSTGNSVVYSTPINNRTIIGTDGNVSLTRIPLLNGTFCNYMSTPINPSSGLNYNLFMYYNFSYICEE